jgi:hypothetical protein
MYVPHSSYRLACQEAADDETQSPELDFVRWGCIACGWSATLKSGKRHIYSKRVFYIDEDSWTALA